MKPEQIGKTPLYVHIPKTGGTFLTSYLQESYGSDIRIWGHGNIREFSNRDKYFKFAILRNPFDWYVSRYFYFGRKRLFEKGLSIDCDSLLFGRDFINKFPTFRDHFYWGVKNKTVAFWLADRVKGMCYVDGQDVMDYYGTLESLSELTEVISKKCGIDARISIHDYSLIYPDTKKRNINPDQRAVNHNHYSEYYDKDMISIVLEKDADILEKFGYSFERKEY